MATLTNPSEIARETLKQLMTRRMAPSPDNYRTIYNEIAGVTEKTGGPFPERELKSLLLARRPAHAADTAAESAVPD